MQNTLTENSSGKKLFVWLISRCHSQSLREARAFCVNNAATVGDLSHLGMITTTVLVSFFLSTEPGAEAVPCLASSLGLFSAHRAGHNHTESVAFQPTLFVFLLGLRYAPQCLWLHRVKWLADKGNNLTITSYGCPFLIGDENI